jgi:AAA domain
MTDKLAPGTARLAYIGQDVALAAPGEKLSVFVERANTAGDLVRKGFFTPEAVEQKLWDVARAYNLSGQPSSEAEEYVADVIDKAVAIDDDGPDGWQGPTEIPDGPGRDREVVHDQGAAGGGEATFTFDLAPYAFPDPASIPAREWLFGRHYIRGAVSATIGAPGRLKSTTVLTEIVGMAVGRDLMTGEQLPSGPLRAAYLNGEEVQDELDRRVAAICQHFGLKPQDCGGRLFVRSTRDKPIRVAVRGPRGDAVVQSAVVTALTDWCDQRQIDAIGIDPLISFHAVRESDNGDMDLVCKEAFGAIAGKARSVDLVHHPRKLAPGESNATVDDTRGASALQGAVRVARVFNFMTAAEAGQIGIAEDDRRRHVRIENGKNNPGPIGKAHWVRIEVENLANGDAVAVSSSWTPPNPFDGVSADDLKLVQNRVQTGEFRADSRSPDWLGWWMAENLPMLNIKTRHRDQPRNKAEVARLNSILKTWLKNNALEIETRPDDKGRKRDFLVSGTTAKTSPTVRLVVDNDDQIIPE